MDIEVINGRFVLSESTQQKNSHILEAVEKINQRVSELKEYIVNELLERLNSTYLSIKKLTKEELINALIPAPSFIREDLTMGIYFDVSGVELDGQIRIAIDKTGNLTGAHIEG